MVPDIQLMVKEYYEISLFMYGHGTGSVHVDFFWIFHLAGLSLLASPLLICRRFMIFNGYLDSNP
jgi:hypothetical protein